MFLTEATSKVRHAVGSPKCSGVFWTNAVCCPPSSITYASPRRLSFRDFGMRNGFGFLFKSVVLSAGFYFVTTCWIFGIG